MATSKMIATWGAAMLIACNDPNPQNNMVAATQDKTDQKVSAIFHILDARNNEVIDVQRSLIDADTKDTIYHLDYSAGLWEIFADANNNKKRDKNEKTIAKQYMISDNPLSIGDIDRGNTTNTLSRELVAIIPLKMSIQKIPSEQTKK